MNKVALVSLKFGVWKTEQMERESKIYIIVALYMKHMTSFTAEKDKYFAKICTICTTIASLCMMHFKNYLGQI